MIFSSTGELISGTATTLPSNPGRTYVGSVALPCTNCTDGSSCIGDADADGLLDVWEVQGLDTNCDSSVDLDLPNMSADPFHRDLYVELDWTVDGTQPTQAALHAAKTTMAASPALISGTTNPDGVPGINLWVDTGSLGDPWGIEPNGPNASCSDGIDGDGDGLIDNLPPPLGPDPDCAWNFGLEGVGPCYDGIDNDGDGLIRPWSSTSLLAVSQRWLPGPSIKTKSWVFARAERRPSAAGPLG